MTEILREIVRHPSAWYGRDLANDSSWIVHLEPAHLAEIAAAIQSVTRRGLPFAALTRDDFPLPTLGPLLRQWQDEIIDGRGFYVLRGLNAADYTDAQVGTIFWAMGLYLGNAVTQNPKGDLLGHVYDHGRRYGDIDVRGYETSAHLPFHTDSGDIVGLLCLRRSKSGGLSSVVSAVTIHNEILKRNPEYLAPLYRGFHYIRREAALTESPVTPYRLPVFGVRDGKVSVRLIRNQINAACTKTGVPLAPIERAALDLFDELAQDPGDPSRHGPAGRRHPVLQQLRDAALAHELRGLSRGRAPPPHDPAVVDHGRAPAAGRRLPAAERLRRPPAHRNRAASGDRLKACILPLGGDMT